MGRLWPSFSASRRADRTTCLSSWLACGYMTQCIGDSIALIRPGTSPTSSLSALSMTRPRRRIIAREGRLLWMCDSEVHLLKGIRGALATHKSLVNMGFSHCDISASNIWLYDEEPNEGPQGFILDADMARAETSFVARTVTVQVPPIKKAPGIYTPPTTRTHTYFNATPVLRGTPVSELGTAQFMAWEILIGLDNIRRQPHHDAESFVWVLAYSAMRLVITRMQNDTTVSSQAIAKFREHFDYCFSSGCLQTIIGAKRTFSPLTWTLIHIYQDAKRQVSQALVDLFVPLSGAVYKSMNPMPADRIYVTHDELLGLLDITIKSLETEQ
ncbi:hypothetical protein DENSPDRAFT_845444 [Dentipellis sp. KUC8613]|nr:hypothetical protein DENSPDRAFT_845444 [Dentipellis sp. KUC8613]